MLYTLTDILRPARENGFAVPAFNVGSDVLARAVLDECAEKEAPVILALYPRELTFCGREFVRYLLDLASSARIPVCVHYDHGAGFAEVMAAISYGFSSVMIDASRLPFAENLALTKKVVEAAHYAGVSVEAELGTISQADGTGALPELYTDPALARSFAEESGADALAVSVGTRHGVYPKDAVPTLRLDLLREIRRLTDIPLVLHGGSSNADEEISAAAQAGASKINISSDIKVAFFNKCREILRDEKQQEPPEIYPLCMDAVRQVAAHKLSVFGAAGKAALYVN